MAKKGYNRLIYTFLSNYLILFIVKGEYIDTIGYLSNIEINYIKFSRELRDKV